MVNKPGGRDGLHIVLSRDHAEIARAVERIERMLVGAGCGVTEARLFATAAEEILANVANHAWPPGEDRRFDVWIRVTTADGTTRAGLVVEDDGIAFDPTRYAVTPDIEADLDDRSIGGLGVHMIRRLTDEQHYARVGNRNVMQIGKTFGVRKGGDAA
jgi:anti-sigma regulatory factor (Ser/Thr protein kinase)